jgi:hypothetical protein
MIDINHDYFAGGRTVALDKLLDLEKTKGLRVSKYYSFDELFGRGARSRPSLEKLGKFGMHGESLRMLDRATAILQQTHPGKKFAILSSDRGYPSARHMEGWAFDVQPPAGVSRKEMANIFIRAGATAMGHYPSFTHVDTHPGRRWTRWSQGVSAPPAWWSWK